MCTESEDVRESQDLHLSATDIQPSRSHWVVWASPSHTIFPEYMSVPLHLLCKLVGGWKQDLKLQLKLWKPW